MTKRLAGRAIFTVFQMGLAMLSGSVQAGEAEQHNWQFFAELHADLRSDLDPQSNQDASDTSAAAGVLYRQDFAHIKLLGEAFDSDNNAELKRLQLGWPMGDDQTLWLGRFYNPIGYWNVHYHHGSYLSPSAHRPEIFAYEDKGGLVPTHLTGMMLTGRLPLVDHTFGYHIAAGEGPELSDKGELKPLDILSPSSTERDRSLTARLSLSQGGASPMETGVFVNHTIIPAKLGSVIEVDQKLFGAFLHVDWSPLETQWTLFTITNTVTQTSGAQQGVFSGGNVWLGYTVNHYWTAYVSFDQLQYVKDDPYLTLFPNFVIARNLAGLRLDFRKNQSLTFEILDSKLMEGSHMHTSVQWSALFE